MIIDSKLRRNIFFTVMGLTVIILLVAGHIASEQQSKAYLNYQKFQEAQKLASRGDYETAGSLLKGLLESGEDGYKVLWSYGACLANTGHYKEAEHYLKEAAEKYPQLYLTQSYVLARGIVAFNLGAREEARKWLKASLKYSELKRLNDQTVYYLKKLEKTEGLRDNE